MFKLVDVPSINFNPSELQEIFNSGQIADGEYVKQLEKAFSKLFSTKNIVAVNSDSSAVFLSLKALCIGPGDVVIMSPMTCLAVSIPVIQTGASIKWCDVDRTSGMLSVDSLREMNLDNVKALVVTHWAGNVADLSEINKFARSKKIAVLEDATEAMGSLYKDSMLSVTDSDFVIYSLGPVKHITAIEGGLILCKDPIHLATISRLKRFGLDRKNFRDSDGEIDPKSDVNMVGGNYSFNNINAFFALQQIKKFDSVTDSFRKNRARLIKILKKYDFIEPSETCSSSDPCSWVMSTLTPFQLPLLRFLKNNGIIVSKLHLKNYSYSCFGDSNLASPLDGVEQFQRTVLCLPCHPKLTDEYFLKLDILLKKFGEENES